MLESAYSKKLRTRLEQIPRSHWIRIQQVSLRGHPDFVGVINGIFVALEVKRSEKESKKRGRQVLQKYVLKKFHDSGAYACIIYPENEDKIIKALTQIAYAEYRLEFEEHIDQTLN